MGWVRLHGEKFDYWSYDLAQWMRLDVINDEIPLEKECRVVFIRVRSVTCVGFPAELLLVEEATRWLMKPGPKIENSICSIQGCVSVIIWHEVTP